MKIKFAYYNAKGNKKKVEVDLPEELVNPSLTLIDDGALISTPQHQWMSGGNHLQSANWYLVNGDTKTKLFHERAFFPHNFFKESRFDYWVNDETNEKCYLKPKEAAIDLHSRGCDISKWVAVQEPYSDEEVYYLQTSDFDEALKYLGYKYVGEPIKKEQE